MPPSSEIAHWTAAGIAFLLVGGLIFGAAYSAYQESTAFDIYAEEFGEPNGEALGGAMLGAFILLVGTLVIAVPVIGKGVQIGMQAARTPPVKAPRAPMALKPPVEPKPKKAPKSTKAPKPKKSAEERKKLVRRSVTVVMVIAITAGAGTTLWALTGGQRISEARKNCATIAQAIESESANEVFRQVDANGWMDSSHQKACSREYAQLETLIDRYPSLERTD